jgi:hypothetical protein
MIYILTLTLILNAPGEIIAVTTIPFTSEVACISAQQSARLRHTLPEGLLRSTLSSCVALKEA